MGPSGFDLPLRRNRKALFARDLQSLSFFDQANPKVGETVLTPALGAAN